MEQWEIILMITRDGVDNKGMKRTVMLIDENMRSVFRKITRYLADNNSEAVNNTTTMREGK